MFRVNNKSFEFHLLLFTIITIELFPQVTSTLQLYRDDLKGDVNNRRENLLDGNKIRTLFYNNGEIGQWPFYPSGEWPMGSEHNYIDGVALLIASEITAPGNNQIVHPLETSYREWMDRDPVTGLLWGLEPVAGYSISSSSKFAMSNDSSTWPSIWPKALNLPEDWNGHWYGYFGRDVFNANQETFFVMDDSKDKEWVRSPYNYYPLASDNERAGLGLRVEFRGFQWDSLQIEDIIFWHYDVINISDFNYPKTYFGFYTDPGIGGTDDFDDDCASFDLELDLTYCFDNDGISLPGNWITGYLGYAFLESPGNAENGIDDDEDGMLDEKRDDGIDNDGDWEPYTDINGNGIWDPIYEPLNDDLGMDGLGPMNIGYTVTDEGEGDGVPTNGEPDFDKTDKDESDQIGLVAVCTYRLGQGGTGGGWPKDDEQIWLKMNYANFDTSLQNANISMVFSSGSFPLNQGLRERLSMALLFGENLEAIINNKIIAQMFYNENYRFSILTSTDYEQAHPKITIYSLSQNYPNPFNPSTKIKFEIPGQARNDNALVTLKVYDILGREIATLVNEEKPAGSYETEFNASNLSTGIYFYQLQAGDYMETKKMILIK